MQDESKGLTIAGRDRNADLHKLCVAWINNLQWEDCEYGAWSNNGKRPFGNSGNGMIARDILEIIGAEGELDRVQACPHCNEVIDEKELNTLYAYAHDLFKAIPVYLARLVK